VADYSFSVGVKEYPMNGTVLRANLADQNLYNRFSDFIEGIDGLTEEFKEKTKGFSGKMDLSGYPTIQGEDGRAEIDPDGLDSDQFDELRGRLDAQAKIFRELDRKVKDKLSYVFGCDNDFDAIFQGVCVWAPDGDGGFILTNFINAIKPLIEQASKTAENGVSRLVGNREQRRAKNRPTSDT